MLYASAPLVTLLRASGIDVATLAGTMDHRVGRSVDPLHCTAPLAKAVAAATGLFIESIARRGNALLLEMHDRGLIYRERSMRDCIVLLPRALPEAVKAGAIGRTLGALVDLGAFATATALADLHVLEELPAWSGSSAFAVAPRWFRLADVPRAAPSPTSQPGSTSSQCLGAAPGA